MSPKSSKERRRSHRVQPPYTLKPASTQAWGICHLCWEDLIGPKIKCSRCPHVGRGCTRCHPYLDVDFAVTPKGGKPNGGKPNGGKPDGGEPDSGKPNSEPNGGKPNNGEPDSSEPNGGAPKT
ncbi:hypothetical protein MMC11_007553 [Xylographa trunciseda]|nr:hypothetical protein [Xylographa trunciseda]